MAPRNHMTRLLAGVAVAAVATAAISQTAGMQESATVSDAAATVVNDQPVSLAVTVDTGMRKLTVPAAGLFSIKAPANTGIEILVDGSLTIDATGTRMETVGTEITGLVSLDAGDHLLEVRGIPADHPDWWRITISAAGGAPVPLIEASQEVDAQTAATILESRTKVMTASDGGTTPTTVASSTGGAPFVIGGGSARAGKAGAAAGSSDGTTNASMVRAAGTKLPGMATSGSRSSGAGTTSVAVPSVGGGGMSGGSGGGSGGTGTGTGTGGTGTGGTGTGGTGTGGTGNGVVTPAPTTPTPTAPTGLVQISPLTPPANVVLTTAVQLTAGGDATGRVPNTGTTLFGAVMDNSMFDIVRVAVSSRDEPTTVDVGPMTGQFAVRLFPEDFAAGGNITVTLTGASSASTEVTAVPVSYSFTGVAPQDGVTQALSRLTFGATPELYARIRAMGFVNFVEEQLSPETIGDASFNAMNVDSLLRRTTQSTGDMFNSLMAHDIAHAAFSEKQLREVMGQFWMNHFHATTKDTDIQQQNIDDRAFFRANALGNFEDLLLYSARSPLMSQFLDNDENSRNNLNENYGREILELSTVGVNAGYTDNDVREVARVFTGWRYMRTNPTAMGVAAEYDFQFQPDRHDTGNKTISFLNLTITGRTGEPGVQEGEELIAVLAQNVNTRNFVCGKIVQLLVADTPPASFVSACAAAWQTSGGEIEAMLRAILLDPTYITTVAYQRNKVKNPFEYAVSVVRAFGARPLNTDEDRKRFYDNVREIFERSGQPILYFSVPTGFSEVAAAWTSSATMISAYNEATEIAERREQYGIDLGADITAAGLETAEEVASYLLTIGTADRFRMEEFEAVVDVLKGTDGIFEPRVANETAALERAMGLVLVTPSFQIQ